MERRSKLKEYLVAESKSGAFFSGGKLIWSEDGTMLFCATFGAVNVIDVDVGRPKFTIGDGSDAINCFTITSDNKSLITAHKSGLFKYWQVSDGQLLKQWKYIHKGTVTALDVGEELLISGGSDSVVRVWNVLHHTCSLALKGSSGVVSVVKFHKTEQRIIISCADDLNINCWDADSGELLYQLSGHYSKVTSVSFHYSSKYLVSCGRDKVLMLWDLTTKCCNKIFPAFESLEDVVCLDKKFDLPIEEKFKEGVYVAAAGEKGIIRIIEMTEGREIYTQNKSVISKANEEGGLCITQLMYNRIKNCFGVTTVDHNIIFYDIATFECTKQLVGFTDEILDIVFVGPNDSYFAVATNSNDIKLYSALNMGCKLLRGHTDLVLSLNSSLVNNCWMISAAKDSTVRLWELDVVNETMTCLATGSRHTSLVSAVCFSQLSTDFFVTSSNDTTLKLWTIQPSKLSKCEVIVKYTEVAHEKDVNDVAISPNDKLIATASQDKTIKLWLVDGLSLQGTLRGHRRGVWCVRFSPVDRVILSSSADTTIKIWSVLHHNCLKTLEGHDASVLRVEFLTKGMQIISTSGDGLLKLWTIKDSECIATFEEHTGKIWALAVANDEETFLTGGSDSLLVCWRNATEEKKLATQKAEEEIICKEQLLSNLIHNNKLFSALSVALSLDKPLKVLNIIKKLYLTNDREDVRTMINKLTDADKEHLLKCAAVWNTNSRNCEVAQFVISVLLEDVDSGTLSKLGNLETYVEQLLPYSQRHFKRLTDLLEELHFLTYTLRLMEPTTKESNYTMKENT